MKKIIIYRLAAILWGLAALVSCVSTDFGNPEDVVKKYYRLWDKHRFDRMYDDFLSTDSKMYATKDEFVKIMEEGEQGKLRYEVEAIPMDINSPTYRRFKIRRDEIYDKNDTTKYLDYRTLLNENGKWKIIWTFSIWRNVYQKSNDGNYTEARQLLEKVIATDPFNGQAYNALSWTYIRDYNMNRKFEKDKIVSNIQYAIELEKDIPDYYNTLAAYYNQINEPQLAISTWLRGIEYCLNETAKTTFYSNIASCYIKEQDYKNVEEFICKALEIDSSFTFALYLYGYLMYVQNKSEDAISYYEKAIASTKMEKALQTNLYGLYAACCYDEKLYDTAKEYIEKALDMDPANDAYKILYKEILNAVK